MANAITGPSPWKVDTVPVTISTNKIYVEALYWFNPTTAGHLFSITDRNSKVIFEGRCEVNAQSQYFRVENWFDGMTIGTLSSGTLYIYFK